MFKKRKKRVETIRQEYDIMHKEKENLEKNNINSEKNYNPWKISHKIGKW